MMMPPTDRQWLEQRFDRMSQEIVTTRHGLKGSMDQLTTQVVELVGAMREHERRITEGEASGRRKGERIRNLEIWRGFLTGGIAVLTVLVGTVIHQTIG